MQRSNNLLHINNRQQIDAIQTSYRKNGGVYTRWSGLVQINPDQPPIRFRPWIGSNSTFIYQTLSLISLATLALSSRPITGKTIYAHASIMLHLTTVIQRQCLQIHTIL